MPSVRFDTLDLQKVLNNTISYSRGFIDGIEIEKIEFNKRLGGFIVEALEQYIDAKARSNPESLHHVYEWNKVGNSSARLFTFSIRVTKNTISFIGKFKKSKSISNTSDEPFVEKARIMEDSITITIEPKISDFLVFDYQGETIFTNKQVVVQDPGGKHVGGSFQKTVDDFFNNYLMSGILQPYLVNLSKADEFEKNFYSVKSSGARISGVKAGREYLRFSGMVIQ